MRINENIAYAKSILNRQSITQDSPEYSDYMKIREICGVNTGYVGILTKIRFIDGVTDMDEIKSIFDILKDSKIELGKLNKLSYDQILDMFFDNLDKSDKKDIELIYSDSIYSYFRVYTYEGILKIGSPSWCLKTKSNWDIYSEKFDQQWVVIDNKYRKYILSPNNNYLRSYHSTKSFIRYGISVKKDGDGFRWIANDDNNAEVIIGPDNYTSNGVLLTIFNLLNGVKKSFYEYLPGCEMYYDSKTYTILKIVNGDHFLSSSTISKLIKHTSVNITCGRHDNYIRLSKSYASSMILITLSNFIEISGCGKDWDNVIGIDIDTHIILEHAKNCDYSYFDGIRLLNGLITIEDIKANKLFIGMVEDKWLLYNYNTIKDYYLVVNIDPKDNMFQIPTYRYDNTPMKNLEYPIAWHLRKSDMKPFMLHPDFDKVEIKNSQCVINYVRNINNKTEYEPARDNEESDVGMVGGLHQPKKIRKFWDFLKRDKNRGTV